jgi:mono/diheme cytochrome c family protein
MSTRSFPIVAAFAVLCACQSHRPPATGDAAKGQATFRATCAICHNTDTGDRKVGPGLKGLVQRTPDASVRAKIDRGGNGMPAFEDVLTAPEKDDLIAYLRTL